MFTHLFKKLELLSIDKTAIKESLNSLELEGIGLDSTILITIVEVNNILATLNSQTSLSVFVDNQKLSCDELEDYKSAGATWRIHINKQRITGKDDCRYLFFYDVDSFTSWAESINPFSKDNLFNSTRCCIQVYKLDCEIIAENFIIAETLNSLPIGGDSGLDNKVITHLRNYDLSKIIKPSKHIIDKAENNSISDIFYRAAIKVMLLSLCDEIYDGTVVLNGVRRIELPIKDEILVQGDIIKMHNLLKTVLEWVFLTDERQELRHKLLIDRMTLDISLKDDFFSGAMNVVKYAYEQAKERYNYAIYDRANQYQSELKDLLKDMKSLGDAYSSKLRSIIMSFSRDFLAALLTIGITLFSRYNDLNNLSSLGLLKYVFIAFGVYVIISMLIQVICDICDLLSSDKEFDYWKKVTREYMSLDDFESHKSNTIKKRKCKFLLQYIIVILLYISLAVFSFSAPRIWNTLTEKPPTKENVVVNKISTNDTIPRNQDTTVCCPQSRK